MLPAIFVCFDMCYVCYVAFELLVSGTKLLSQALVWYSIVVMLYVDFKVIHMIIMCVTVWNLLLSPLFFSILEEK